MVNRAGDGNKIIAPDGWSAQVATELEKEAKRLEEEQIKKTKEEAKK